MTSRFKWPEDFQTLTTDRKDKGFSVIQFAIGFPCDITEFDPRGANEAGFPTSQDYCRINPEYFDRVDLRVQHLVDQGMVPNILGTWGYYLPWFGQENMRRYHLGERDSFFAKGKLWERSLRTPLIIVAPGR